MSRTDIIGSTRPGRRDDRDGRNRVQGLPRCRPLLGGGSPHARQDPRHGRRGELRGC
jgi:hypothetical protein